MKIQWHIGNSDILKNNHEHGQNLDTMTAKQVKKYFKKRVFFFFLVIIMSWGVIQMLPNALRAGKEVSISSKWR